MAEEKPEQTPSEDVSKKDTVRINLPPGLTAKTKTSPVKPPVPKAPESPPAKEEESKKETAVMGKVPATPKPKSDTSRVHVPGAKPSVPEMPRPTVKLRREAEPAAAPATTVGPPGAPAGSAPRRSNSSVSWRFRETR